MIEVTEFPASISFVFACKASRLSVQFLQTFNLGGLDPGTRASRDLIGKASSGKLWLHLLQCFRESMELEGGFDINDINDDVKEAQKHCFHRGKVSIFGN